MAIAAVTWNSIGTGMKPACLYDTVGMPYWLIIPHKSLEGFVGNDGYFPMNFLYITRYDQMIIDYNKPLIRHSGLEMVKNERKEGSPVCSCTRHDLRLVQFVHTNKQ
jgi:hypothetical protein